METNIKKSILVGNKINDVEKIIKEIIPEINGFIINIDGHTIEWNIGYGTEIIEFYTSLITQNKNTQIR